MLKNLLFASILALLLSGVLTPLVRRLAFAIGAVDHPNERKVHEGLMPRLGGLAIFVSFAGVALLFGTRQSALTGLLLADLIIVAVGVYDDTRGVSPKMKLFGQVMAALVLVEFGYRIDFLSLPVSMDIIVLERASLIVTVFWLVGITNAVNLIDGLDGLAAGTTLISVLVICFSAYRIGLNEAVLLGAIFAGAVLGFLPYNFHPARIFMGDTGSMLLGFNVAAFAILGMTKSVTVIALLLPVLILGVPILDTTWAILRRASRGRRIFEADKKHLHHRLLHMGLSHRGTVLSIYGLSVFLGLCAMLIQSLSTWWSVALFMLIAAALVGFAIRLGLATDEREGGRNDSHES